MDTVAVLIHLRLYLLDFAINVKFVAKMLQTSEDTHLTDLNRIEKLLLLVMVAFVWCYNVGELVRLMYKPIRILKHGRKAKSIFRYGLDIVTEFLLRGRNEYKIPIFNFSAIVSQILTPD